MKIEPEIIEIKEQADILCREITADLPEYFGIAEANEHYATGVLTRVNFAARYDDKFIGLLSLEFPYPNNANIYWMAVLKAFHGQGVGSALINAAEQYALLHGAKTITVESLAPTESDENYLKTYNFYSACGFKPLFNLKPQGYDWNMVYMEKSCASACKVVDRNLSIRDFYEADIDTIVECFARHHWQKPRSTFENYLDEQMAGIRQVWVAFESDQLAGYVTLSWHSKYEPFFGQNIPEIMDLNVLPPYRKHGVGSKLIETAEDYAAKKVSIIGIGVGLYDGYGDAQRLYVKKGYVPDGKGPTYDYNRLNYGQSVVVDDDLVMWFTKILS